MPGGLVQEGGVRQRDELCELRGVASCEVGAGFLRRAQSGKLLDVAHLERQRYK